MVALKYIDFDDYNGIRESQTLATRPEMVVNYAFMPTLVMYLTS